MINIVSRYKNEFNKIKEFFLNFFIKSNVLLSKFEFLKNIYKKINKNKVYIKYFLISSYISMLFLIFIMGIITVEKNSRYIAFGDTTPFFEYDLNSSPKFIKFIIIGKEIKIFF